MKKICDNCWCNYCVNEVSCRIDKMTPCAKCLELDADEELFNRETTACKNFKRKIKDEKLPGTK